MAELLVKLVDNVHSDPAIDERGSWKRGDIVAVKPDGFLWGREETWPKFTVITVPDLSVEELLAYASPPVEIVEKETSIALVSLIAAGLSARQSSGKTYVTISEQPRRRLYSLDLSSIAGAENGAITIMRSALLPLLSLKP